MGKLKLGILGNGYLADIIVEAGLKGMLDEYELVGVLGRTREKTELLAKKGGCQACGTIDELLALSPDYVAEAASVQSVKDCGVKILESGAGMIVLSIGAFADHEFFGQIKAAAAATKPGCTLRPARWEDLMCCGHIPYGAGRGRHQDKERTGVLKGNPAFCRAPDGGRNGEPCISRQRKGSHFPPAHQGKCAVAHPL